MPFTLSHIFSEAFSSLRKGFVPLLVVTLLLYILPNQVITVGLRLGMGITLGSPQSLQGGILAITVVAFVIMYVLVFMHISAVYEVCVLTMTNKPVKLGQVFAHSLGNALPIFLIYLLCILGWLVGTVLLLVPAIIFCTFFSVVIPAYVTEKPGIFGAFTRSRALTKGHRWGIFGLWILLLIIFYILAAAIEVPLLWPLIQATMKQAAEGGQPVAPVPPSLGVMLALSVAGSFFLVVILSINASVYSCLRFEKDKLSAAGLEKVFE